MSYFGKNVRKIRNAKKISQSAFAELFDLTRASIGAYEEGRAEAKIDTVIEIANYFDVSLDQLLKKELTINEIFHIHERMKHLSAQSKQINELKQNFDNQEINRGENTGLEKRLDNIEHKIDKLEKLIKQLISNNTISN